MVSCWSWGGRVDDGEWEASATVLQMTKGATIKGRRTVERLIPKPMVKKKQNAPRLANRSLYLERVELNLAAGDRNQALANVDELAEIARRL